MENKEIWGHTPFLCNALYNQNTIEKWTKDNILLFPKKGNHAITKNYGDRTITVTMVYSR